MTNSSVVGEQAIGWPAASGMLAVAANPTSPATIMLAVVTIGFTAASLASYDAVMAWKRSRLSQLVTVLILIIAVIHRRRPQNGRRRAHWGSPYTKILGTALVSVPRETSRGDAGLGRTS